MTLLQKHCGPCASGTPPMDEKDARQYLQEVPGWELEDGRIRRELVCEDFLDAVDKVQAIAEVAEDEGHHPDLCIRDYKRLHIELTTHHIGGLSENDFILAAKLDRLL